MFQEEDNSGNRKFWGKSRHKLTINGWLTDVFQASGHGLEDFNGVGALCTNTMTSVKPRGNRKNENNEGISQYGNEEEQAGCGWNVR